MENLAGGRRYSVVLGLLVVVVSLIVVYFRVRLRYADENVDTSQIKFEQVRVALDSPIKKEVLDNGAGARYTLEGSFPDGVRSEQDRPLEGDFVLKDDPAKRRFGLFLSNSEGGVFIGRYTDLSFQGNSSWKEESKVEAFSSLNNAKMVQVDIKLNWGNVSDSSSVKYYRDLEKMFDGIIEEYNSGKFEEGVERVQLLISPTRVGIVEE